MTAVPLAQPSATRAPKYPYRGIEEFRYVDSAIFFGRDVEAQQVLRLVKIYRGVLLYGASGVGKSSLVNAKLMPLAVKGGYAPERVRVQPVKGKELVVERIAPDDEGDAVLPSLFEDHTGNPRINIAAEEFLAKLQERCRVDASTRDPYPLIIVDQFEELETLTEEHRGDPDAEKAHDAITDALLAILRDTTLRVKLLFVFREDYYAKLTRFFAQFPTLVDNYLRLEPMHSSQLDDIINGPFQKVTFDHELPKDVADLLKTELTAHGDLLTLSEVQIACLYLWLSPEPMMLLQEQHVGGILEKYFSEGIESLPLDLRDPAKALLDELVTESGTRNVSSAETLIKALWDDHGVQKKVTERVLEALDQTTHIIRRERRNDVEVYEIVSEFLIPWIMRRRKLQVAASKQVQRRRSEAIDVARSVIVGVAIVVGALFLGREMYGFLTAGVRRDYTEAAYRFDQAAHRLQNVNSELRELRKERDSLKSRLESLVQSWPDWMRVNLGLQVAEHTHGTPGVVVTEVVKGSPAARFASVGDVIVAMKAPQPDGSVSQKTVKSVDDFRSILATAKDGDTLGIVYVRPGSLETRVYPLTLEVLTHKP